MNAQNTDCCPEFNPDVWDMKEFQWNDKKFIKDKVFTLLFMPVNFGSVIRRMMGKADEVKAEVPERLCLSHHTSKWNMDLYLAVDQEIPGTRNVTLSGRFLSKVYEGDFKETGKWTKDFESFAGEKNRKIKTMYMWYTTCPKCAKKYGKNYVVFIAEVE